MLLSFSWMAEHAVRIQTGNSHSELPAECRAFHFAFMFTTVKHTHEYDYYYYFCLGNFRVVTLAHWDPCASKLKQRTRKNVVHMNEVSAVKQLKYPVAYARTGTTATTWNGHVTSNCTFCWFDINRALIHRYRIDIIFLSDNQFLSTFFFVTRSFVECTHSLIPIRTTPGILFSDHFEFGFCTRLLLIRKQTHTQYTHDTRYAQFILTRLMFSSVMMMIHEWHEYFSFCLHSSPSLWIRHEKQREEY